MYFRFMKWIVEKIAKGTAKMIAKKPPKCVCFARVERIAEKIAKSVRLKSVEHFTSHPSTITQQVT